MTDFPKIIIVEMGRTKEENAKLGRELGLSNEAIQETFAFALEKVKVKITLYKTGTYEIKGFEEI